MTLISLKELWIFKKESDRFPLKMMAGNGDRVDDFIFSVLYPYKVDDYFTGNKVIELSCHCRIFSTEEKAILAKKAELARRAASSFLRFIEINKIHDF